MRILLFLLLSFSLLFSTSIEHKIKTSKKALKSKKIEYKKMDKELSLVAKRIANAKKEQTTLTQGINELSQKIKENEIASKALLKEDKEYSNKLNQVKRTVTKKQKKFLDLVAKNFSLALALEEIKRPTKESVMMREAYKIYETKNKQEIKMLEKDMETLKSKIKKIQVKKQIIQQTILKHKNERQEYVSKKKKQDILVKNLARDKAIYKKRFNKIKASRKKLERKLASLNIIKHDRKKEKEKKRRAEKRAIALAKASRKNSVKKEAPIVLSTPEQASYQGRKTISPLRGARLIKQFGSYIDPVYKFKIFNKSITLKAPHVNAKVRSVLAGKVVFAENSGGMLGKVVIIEHANKIHTIYAKLSRLAPGIHVGKRVRASTIIGKVDSTLMLEVTKNNKHMNPLKLIRL